MALLKFRLINENILMMKKIFCLLIIFFFTQIAKSQLLKDIGRGIKKDAEYRLERKARDAVNKSLDSLEKKAKNKKSNKTETGSRKATEIKASEMPGAAGQEAVEGFITLKLSTPITTKGLSITISGQSIHHDKWIEVKIEVAKPNKEEEVITTNMNSDGKFAVIYDKLMEEGDYVITAISSDGKAKASERLYVTDFYQPQDETTDLMEAVGDAFNRLKAREQALKPMLSPADAGALQDKVKDVKDKVDALKKVLEDLHAAKKEIAALYKSGKIPSKNIRQNLSQLNDMIASQTEAVKKIKGLTQHEPFDNTVCEYIAMLNEACAAFSTFTNGFASSLYGVLKNIMLDKAVPKATEKGIDAAVPDVFSKNEVFGDEAVWGAKEASKIFATANFDMKGLTSKLGKAGFAGDVVQFATDVLMKTHCGVFKGKVEHFYNYMATNSAGQAWWDYTVTSEAAITLRYPKTANGIIQMKGTIEGNATKFSCTINPKLNPDYIQGTGGKVQTTVLKTYTPYELPFATALHDELGFGMAARAVATPAYFLIPVDAEYNTQTGKLKLHINEALVDFLPTVFNSQVFIQWVAGLPKLRRMDYPISKARLTMYASLKEKNEFDVKKDAKGNLSFSDAVKRHIEGDEQEHFLDFTITAKKE